MLYPAHAASISIRHHPDTYKSRSIHSTKKKGAEDGSTRVTPMKQEADKHLALEIDTTYR